MTALYPLRFEPIFRRYLWGGRRLASVLGKQIGEGDDFAESWEIVDHGEDQSIVLWGPEQGTTLTELVRQRGEDLLGRHHTQEQFPLLFKFLDAHRVLSVQVHPNDEQAARLDPPDLGKTEAWVVIHADPGSRIYAGLKSGVDRQRFQQSIAAGQAESCLHCFEPQVGDCVYIPAGTVHALGQGLVVAEIQQASNTTFRLFDWNRVGSDGQPRALHVQAGLGAVDFERGPISPQKPVPNSDSAAERLLECEKFVLDRHVVNQCTEIGGDDRFHLIAVLDGGISIQGDPHEQPLVRGQTCLLPACIGTVALDPLETTTFLDVFLPLA
jgi:mannose-6-phosphate isomerase